MRPLRLAALTATLALAATGVGVASPRQRDCSKGVRALVGQTELIAFRLATRNVRCDEARAVVRAYLVQKVSHPYGCAERSLTRGCDIRRFVCHETYIRRYGGALNYCAGQGRRLSFYETGRRD